MTTLRTIAGPLLIGLIPLSIGCSSDKKAANPWAGKTYGMSIPTDNWKHPKGSVGPEFGKYIPSFLLEVKDNSVVVGAGDAAGNQDMCSPTTEISTSSPQTQIGPVDGKLHVTNSVGSSAVASLYGLTFKSIFTDTPGAATLQGQFLATFDVRQVYTLFNQLPNSTAQSICDTLSTSFDTTCGACPNDSEAFCTDMWAINLAAVPLTTGSLQPVSFNGLSASCTKIVESDAGTSDGGT